MTNKIIITMKQFYLFFMCLLASINMNAQDKVMTIDNQTSGCLSGNVTDEKKVTEEDLITNPITVNVKTAGTLSNIISGSKKYKITDLTIMGKLNGTDIGFLREMAGCDYNGASTGGSLKNINLYDASIVAGGLSYFHIGGMFGYGSDHGATTSDNAIGMYMFYGCRSLESIVVPKTVNVIADYAFQKCNLLKSISFSNAINYISKLAFDASNPLTTIKIDGISQWIEQYSQVGVNIPRNNAHLLSGDGEILNLVIPSTIKSIEDEMFKGFSYLQTVTIPRNVSAIGKNAFEGCNSLAKVYIEDLCAWSQISFGNKYANPLFYAKHLFLDNDKEVVELSSEDLTQNIHSYAFVNWEGLKNVELPANMKSIGSSAFEGCNLTNVELSSNITHIGSSAFAKNEKLKAVYVSWESPLSISSDVFSGINKQECILFVPKGTYQSYWLSTWGDNFDNIEEYDVTGIDSVLTSEKNKENSRYSVNGIRLGQPTKGLNIVKYSDGSIRKEIVK